MSPKRAAGLVIFRNVNKAVQFLLMQTSYGEHHWTPPKVVTTTQYTILKVLTTGNCVSSYEMFHTNTGHVDPGESDWDTAIRETREEAGYTENDLEVYKDISKTLSYEVMGKPKVVVYWLAKLKNPDQEVTMSDEHQGFRWLPLKEAQEVSGYADMKQLLDEFNEKAILKL